ncbi:T9SS type A sorting domain-containing protein [Bacteroidota bacterium]
MKKLFALFLTVFFCYATAFAQVEVPNGDFENSNGNYISGWDLKSGTAQVREYLTLTNSSGTMTVEPISGQRFITLMNDGGSLGKLEANFPLTERPQNFSFYCGYIPGTSGEKFGFFLIFTKYNPAKGMNDTILSVGGYLPPSGQIVPWARISGSLSSYYQTDEVPDKAQIVFMPDVATNAMGQIIATPYTLLALDKVEFPQTLNSTEPIQLSNVEAYKAYPNPFSSTTNISFELLNNSHVKVQVFDIHGKLISTLLDADRQRGNHIVFFTPVDLPGGIYIYRIETDLGIQSGKLLLK